MFSFLFWSAWLFFVRPVTAQSAYPIVRTVSSRIADEIVLEQKHLVGNISATPKCWTTALGILSGLQEADVKTPSDFCSELTQFQQDVLALELAKCHSKNSPTSFYEDEDSSSQCEKVMSQSVLDSCLPRLNESSFSRFVDFNMHVQNLCVRFTDEMVLARREQAALLLTQSSSIVAEQLAGLAEQNDKLYAKVEQQDELLERHAHLLNKSSEAFEKIRNDLSLMEIVSGGTVIAYSCLCTASVATVSLILVMLLTSAQFFRPLRWKLLHVSFYDAVAEALSHYIRHLGYIGGDLQLSIITFLRRSFFLYGSCVVLKYLLVDNVISTSESSEVTPKVEDSNRSMNDQSTPAPPAIARHAPMNCTVVLPRRRRSVEDRNRSMKGRSTPAPPASARRAPMNCTVVLPSRRKKF